MENSIEMKVQFASLMGELGIAFGASPDKETMAVYFKHLSDCSFFQVDKAINQLIRTGERFPTVAKIRELAVSFREYKSVTMDHIQIEEFTGDDYPKNADDAMAFIEGLNKAIDSGKRSESFSGQIGPLVDGLTVVELADELL